MDLSDRVGGVAILNDSKYGMSVSSNVMSMSLLRSPKWPDPNCDMGSHHFRYGIYAHEHVFESSDVVQKAYEFQEGMLQGYWHPTAPPKHTIQLLNPHENVMIDWCKCALDESGDVILRLYEAYGAPAQATIVISFSITQANVCNLLEEFVADVKVEHDRFTLNLKAHEVMSVRIRR